MIEVRLGGSRDRGRPAAEGLVKRCDPLARAFGAVSGEHAVDKGTVLARAIEPALVACNCNVDIPALRSVMFRVLYVPRPLRFIVFDRSTPAERISFAATTPWAEASKRLTPATRNAALVVR